MLQTALRIHLNDPENLTLLGGEETIPLNTGSPPFPVDSRVKRAMTEAIGRIDALSYPPTEGLQELREEVASFSRGTLGLPFDAANIVITYGAMQALYLAARYVAQAVPGAEVLLPAPFWFHFPKIVESAGAVPVIFPTSPETGFKLTPALLQRYLTAKSRLLLLTQPGNPTGSVYSREELAALAAVIERHPRLLVAADEVYNLLLLDGAGPIPRAAPSLGSLPSMAERVLTLNSFSKNQAMSGLRVGWIGAAERHVAALVQLQRFTTLGANEILQHGALAALTATSEIVGDIVRQLLVRRPLAAKLLGGVPGFRFSLPESSYYFWVDVRAYDGCRAPDGKTIRNDEDLANFLLKDGRVAVVPGTSCHLPGYFRITYAVPEATLALGVSRIRKSLEKLHCPGRENGLHGEP
ncbi:MAG: aminotransferase class I/II-fold pyridoxal phosphate-dependent enzyme [Thermoanaerobaculia bacterium]